MADRSAIEWTDSTFNPWIGCTKVSPACDHCYAEVSTPSRTRGVEWGAGKPRQRTSHANWNEVRRWNAREYWACSECTWRGEAPSDNGLAFCPRCEAVTPLKPARRRVFCASLADVFDNEVHPQWRADLFELIEATPNLDWLLLTKRIGNVPEMMPIWWLAGARPQPNVWLGATICNQAEADRDIPKLLRVPAAVRFLSIEPMLGPIDLSHRAAKALPIYWQGTPADGPLPVHCGHTGRLLDHVVRRGWVRYDGVGIDWVIVGGESGPNARPMHPDWARSLRDQCAASGVPFLFKQWGEFIPYELDLIEGRPEPWRVDPNGKRSWGLKESCTPRESWSPVTFAKVGKKTAGRVLDGVTHDGYPEVRCAHP